MQGPGISQLLELAEISEWVDWMRRTLPASDIQLPNEETSVLFAANAVRFAERIRPFCHHLPISLRSMVIEAGILRQCAVRQRQLRDRSKDAPERSHRGLAMLEGVSCVEPADTRESPIVLANDGFHYVLRFHDARASARMATEAICLALARSMGLPTPGFATVSVSGKLHALIQNSPRNTAACLGLRLTQTAPPESHRLALGFLIFDILTLNSGREFPPRSQGVVNLSHCLCDADWPHFLSSTYTDSLAFHRTATRVRSFVQLEPWLRKVQNVDMNPLWELAFHLPPQWFGDDRIGITRVLDKISARIGHLRNIVHHLVQTGYFLNIKKDAQSASEPSVMDSFVAHPKWDLRRRAGKQPASLKLIM